MKKILAYRGGGGPNVFMVIFIIIKSNCHDFVLRPEFWGPREGLLPLSRP